MSSTFSTKHGGILHNQDGNWQENPDGIWSQAIPMPFYGPVGMKKCECGRHFFREQTYRDHYQQAHTDGKKYRRTAKGLEEL